MGLETGSYIADLVITNPTSSDAKSQGDDHLRLLKTALRNCFAGFAGPVVVTGTDGGSADTYTLTPTTAVPAYVSRMVVLWSPAATNLTTTPTLNVSGLGAKSLKDVAGNAPKTGDYVINCLYLAVYNGTEFRNVAVTKQYVDQLSFSSALPSQTGNTGKVVKTDGSSASWEYAGIDNMTSSAVSLTLTTRPTVAIMTPTDYGVVVTAPDATTCSLNDSLYRIDVRSSYPVVFADSTGVLRAVCPGNSVTTISLTDKSTAAGTWVPRGSGDIDCGPTGRFSIDGYFAALSASMCGIAITSTIDLIFLRNSSGHLYCCTWNRSTKAQGTITAVRTTNCYQNFTAVQKTSGQVAIFSVTAASTAGECVVVSLSGNNPVINTVATTTLTGNISSLSGFSSVLSSGGEMVVVCSTATPASRIYSISFSGTTPTISSATTLDGETHAGVRSDGAGKVVACSYTTSTSTFYWRPYTISGTTITTGTGCNAAVSTATFRDFRNFGSYYFTLTSTSTTWYAHVVTLSGTTTTVSNVSLALGASAVTWSPISSTKYLVASMASGTFAANIVTNTAGTASIGTQLTFGDLAAGGSSAFIMGCDASKGYVLNYTAATQSLVEIDVSGASPSLLKERALSCGASSFIDNSANYLGTAIMWAIGSNNKLRNFGIVNSSVYGTIAPDFSGQSIEPRPLRAMTELTYPVRESTDVRSNRLYGFNSTVNKHNAFVLECA